MISDVSFNVTVQELVYVRHAGLFNITVVLTFDVCSLCSEQLSNQTHYDFGLRALKSVLVSAGNVKRDRFKSMDEGGTEEGKQSGAAETGEKHLEQEVSMGEGGGGDRWQWVRLSVA